jgi:hypothetical protein
VPAGTARAAARRYVDVIKTLNSTPKELAVRAIIYSLFAIYCVVVGVQFLGDDIKAQREVRAVMQSGHNAEARIVGEDVRHVKGAWRLKVRVTIQSLNLEWRDQQQQTRSARVYVSSGYFEHLDATDPDRQKLIAIRYGDAPKSTPIILEDADHRLQNSGQWISGGFLIVGLLFAMRVIFPIWRRRRVAGRAVHA